MAQGLPPLPKSLRGVLEVQQESPKESSGVSEDVKGPLDDINDSSSPLGEERNEGTGSNTHSGMEDKLDVLRQQMV